MKNILLIGGTGFIGSNVVKHLLRQNYNISIFELPNSNVFIPNIKIYYGRIEQIDLIKKIIAEDEIDTVIHLASSLIPSSSLDAYLIEFNTIVKPTIELLPFLAEKNIVFVFLSSGGTIYGVNDTGVFSETDNKNPISYYGQSKLILEESIMLEHRKSGLIFFILRPSNPYGIGQNIFGKQGFIAASIGHMLNQEKITVWGDGSIVRDYIHIDDLSKNIIEILEIGNKNEIYNIGCGKGYSINEIVEVLRKCTKNNLEIEYVEGRSVDVPSMVLNVCKIQSFVGPTIISLEKGIIDFFNYELKKNGEK